MVLAVFGFAGSRTASMGGFRQALAGCGSRAARLGNVRDSKESGMVKVRRATPMSGAASSGLVLLGLVSYGYYSSESLRFWRVISAEVLAFSKVISVAALESAKASCCRCFCSFC